MLHYIYLITNRNNSIEKFWKKQTKLKRNLPGQGL